MNYLFISTRLQKIATAIVLLFLSFSASAQTNVYSDIIATSPNHTYLAAALQQEGLDVVLQDQNASYTVFAPTNAAFDNL
ncbi:MAG: fasciclin domain-containing protein, partial [Bacteroidia bacterium]|nr:fasciclin domain-containing protein [Bacteroidia bacterium]